jgi:hypothetical protein
LTKSFDQIIDMVPIDREDLVVMLSEHLLATPELAQ